MLGTRTQACEGRPGARAAPRDHAPPQPLGAAETEWSCRSTPRCQIGEQSMTIRDEEGTGRAHKGCEVLVFDFSSMVSPKMLAVIQCQTEGPPRARSLLIGRKRQVLCV
uniref:Uncharacterized protein n=1 Tax=Rangifer tarandus platyrhynchus TaxID=3082113 RepID=A0ACB0E9J5_RANTA|nr:unnamed protein product [Rangifer tarandus platyrhynchus]